MIARTYFMSVKKPHDDGSGSYSFQYCTGTVVSFLPSPKKVFNEMLKNCESEMKSKPGSVLEVVAFNRC